MIDLRYEGDIKGLFQMIGEEICEYCLGTGEVSILEPVYPNEAPMAYIGSRTCICQLSEPDYESDNQ